MEQLVRVCRSCGHFNPADGPSRCSNCFVYLIGVDAVPQESVVLPRRRIPRWVRRRPVFLLTLTLVLGFIAWRIALLFDMDIILFPPSKATTDINASIGSQTWAQARRTLENTGFTPDQAPHPQEIRWTFDTAKPLLAPPAVVEDRVYLSTEDGRTVALDGRSGRVIWEYRTGLPSGSTPAVVGDLVISVVRPGLITALDTETGSLRWEVDIKAPIFSSPLVADGVMCITSSWNRVFALDAASGKEIWHYDHPRTEDIPGLYGTWNRGVSTGSRQPDWARAGLKQPGWKQTGSRLSPRAAAALLSLLSLAAVPSLAQTTIRLDDAALHAAMERRAGRRACARSTMIWIK